MLRARVLLPLLPLLLATACASTNEALLSKLGQPLEQLDPLPYRIAIAPALEAGALPPTESAEDVSLLQGKPLVWDLGESADGTPETLQDILPGLLGDRFRAAAAVVAFGEPAAGAEPESADKEGGEAQPRPKADEEQRYLAWRTEMLDRAEADEFDLVIIPRLKQRPFLDKKGITKRWPIALGLWLTTWIGGLYVEDRVYHTSVTYEFEIWDPHRKSGRGVVAPVEVAVKETRTRFKDRQAGNAAGWAQSLIIPPFWTVPKRTILQRQLSRQVCLTMAGRLSQYLKEDLPGDLFDERGRFRVDKPPTRENQQLKATLVSRKDQELEHLSIRVNDGEWRDAKVTSREVRLGLRYTEIAPRLELVPGENRIRIRYRYVDDEPEVMHWRTLVVPPKPSKDAK